MKSALRIFRLFSLSPGLPAGGKVGAKLFVAPVNTSAGKKQLKKNPKQPLTGCSSILSIPLPNNGLYDDIPCECTTTALAHIAQLTDALSAALNIPLPHPLLPFTSGECLISPQYDLSVCYSLAPVLHINDRAEHVAFSWTTPFQVRTDSSSTLSISSIIEGPVPHVVGGVTPPTPTAVAVAGGAGRVRGASFDPTQVGSVRDAATTLQTARIADIKYVPNHAFTQALTLLQADVVALCLRAGIPPECLWPPQAILLNLAELQLLCAKCVKRNTAVTTSSSGSDDENDSTFFAALPLVDASLIPFASSQNSLHSITHRYAHNAHSRSSRSGQHTVLGLQEHQEDSGMSVAAVWEEHDYDVVDDHFEEVQEKRGETEDD